MTVSHCMLAPKGGQGSNLAMGLWTQAKHSHYWEAGTPCCTSVSLPVLRGQEGGWGSDSVGSMFA